MSVATSAREPAAIATDGADATVATIYVGFFTSVSPDTTVTRTCTVAASAADSPGAVTARFVPDRVREDVLSAVPFEAFGVRR